MHHNSVYYLMSKEEDPEKSVLRSFDEEVKRLRKSLKLGPGDEQKFVEIKAKMIGMLRGYRKKYARDLAIETHVANEHDVIYPLENGLKIRTKLDNIVAVKNKWYLHEMKAWKSLNPDTVNNVKNSLQIAIYFHIHNQFYKKTKIKGVDKVRPFSGIIFDMTQKPAIRQKTGESYRGFIKRLEKSYEGPDAGSKFYKEALDEPAINQKDVMNTIYESAERMRRIYKTGEALKTFNDCGWCDYYEVCYGGMTKENLSLYKSKVEEEEK